jgi:trigger factor
MEVKVENLGECKKKIIIKVPAKEMAGFFISAYKKVAPTVKIDGFRTGKAPRKLVEGVVGVARLLSEGLDLAVSESYFKAITENKINPIGQPNIVINKYPSYGHTAEEIKGDLEFEAEVEILPKFDMPDISKLKVIKPKKEEAKKEDIEKVISHFKKQSAVLTEVDRSAKIGDQAEISYEGFLKNVKMDSMCSKNHPLVLGENTLIPGFEENIVGLKKGDKKDFKITFPKDYHAKELAGKETEFKVEILTIREIKMPELNDAFAEKFGHKNIKELEEAVKKHLNQELEENYSREVDGLVIEKVLPLVKITLPKGLIDQEVVRMIEDFGKQVTARGLNFDQYLESTKKTREDLAKEMRPQAEKNVKVGLLLGKIIEEKKWDHIDQTAGRKAIDYLVEKIAK